jgi:HSP20 family molecular chaperone IbpA
MHTIISPLPNRTRSPRTAPVSPDAFRQPNYECQEQSDAMKLTVYVPGVEAVGVDIEGRGADLTITARKAHLVRVNWQALHLEGAQRDYRLKLRLGAGFDFAAMDAEIRHGVLTITLPKRGASTGHLRQVA